MDGIGILLFLSIKGQLAIVDAMFFPGISSLIVRRFIVEGLEDARLRWGPRRLYLQAYVIVLAIFIAAYGLTAVLFTRPDFTLSAFSQMYGMALSPNPGPILLAVFITTIAIAPIFNSIPAFGEELGWWGYLIHSYSYACGNLHRPSQEAPFWQRSPMECSTHTFTAYGRSSS